MIPVGLISRGRASKPKFHLILVKSCPNDAFPSVDVFSLQTESNPDILWESCCIAAMRHSTALRLFSLLNVLSNTSEPPSLRTPCSYTPLWRFVANSHEISGLDEESVSCSSIMPGFMSDLDSVDKHIGTTGTSIPYSLGTGK